MKLLLLLFLSFSISGYSQVNYEWAENLAQISIKDIHTVHTYDNGDFMLLCEAGTGMMVSSLVKLDAQRNVIWSREIPAAQLAQTGNLMAVDNEGNIFVAGGFCGSMHIDGEYLSDPGGSCSGFICKFDQSGDLLWARAIAGINGYASARSIACDELGNVIVVGEFNGVQVDFDNISVNFLDEPATNNDYIAKYDTQGNILWAKNVGSIRMELCNFGLTVDSNNDIYITTGIRNETFVFGNDTLVMPHSENNAMLLAKYSEQGDEIWARTAYPTAAISTVYGICVTTDDQNNVYVGGTMAGETSFPGLSNYGGNDGFVAKYDDAGNLLWANNLGSGAFDECVAIVVDKHENLFVTGNYEGPYITSGANSSGNSSWNSVNVFLAKYNDSGNLQWLDALGGQYVDKARHICVDSANNVYASGFFESPSLAVGSDVITSVNPNGSWDAYLVKIGQESNELSVGVVEKDEISVFPNPFNDFISVKVNESFVGSRLIVSDIKGTILQEIPSLPSNSEIIELTDVPNGMYYLTIIRNGMTVVTEKIISLE